MSATATHATRRRLRGRPLLAAIAEGTAGTVGDEFLRCLVRHVAEAFGARIAFVAESTGPGRARALACWLDGAFQEPWDFETEGTPCARLPGASMLAVPESLAARFPDDREALEMGLESYLAVCLRDAGGRHLGHLAVLDGARMEVADEDVATLRIFAARAAAELERRAQAAELAASRARVVEAADAERRRVGRDLHDGAQQRLLAVSNLLRVARKRIPAGDPAERLLDGAAEELDRAHADLRELARGLYPVALTERGLPSALASLAAGCAMTVELAVADEALPEAVATAAYFMVAECLANANRHARAETATVRVEVRDGHVEIEVADGGAGGADVTAGTGLRGLADRIAVLGGSLQVESPAGEGTRVLAAVPLEPAA